MVSRMPPGWNSTSARVSAASSERRIAEAKPSRIIAASRAPRAVERSMCWTIWRISPVPSGWAWRRGAVPMIRRRPRRTCRTPSVRTGSFRPCIPWRYAMAPQARSMVPTERPPAARSVRYAQISAGSAGNGGAPRLEHQRSHWLHAKSYTVRVDSACAAVIASLIRTASSTVRPAGRWGGRAADVRAGFTQKLLRREQHRRRRVHCDGGVAIVLATPVAIPHEGGGGRCRSRPAPQWR